MLRGGYIAGDYMVARCSHGMASPILTDSLGPKCPSPRMLLEMPPVHVQHQDATHHCDRAGSAKGTEVAQGRRKGCEAVCRSK